MKEAGRNAEIQQVVRRKFRRIRSKGFVSFRIAASANVLPDTIYQTWKANETSKERCMHPSVPLARIQERIPPLAP